MSDDVEDGEFLRAGDTIVLDGEPWEVLAAQHESDGGDPRIFSVQWKVLDLRNLLSGVQARLCSPLGRPFVRARLEEKTMQFLYQDSEELHFMDCSSFEQSSVPGERLPHLAGALREGELVEARAFEGRPVPHTVRRRPLPPP